LDINKTLKSLNCCVIIPTYNNENTLNKVVTETLQIVGGASSVIVVNDGSTDSTAKILNALGGQIDLISYPKNKGKGFALRVGFKKAIELGYERAITIDSDGQHFPSDIRAILKTSQSNPSAVVMGIRNMGQDTVPGKSNIGNKISNFWFRVETFISLEDTQTGFRLYPLKPISKLKLFSNKFELEIELIVRLAWGGVPFEQSPVKVLYDEQERVTHFRPFRDFLRITLLNTILFTLCLVYYYPKRLFSLETLRVVRDEAVKPNESSLNKALSISFGCFMGVVPIWGLQLLVGLPLAMLFRLNKVLFVAAANISIPPFIPVIIYMSLLFGQYTVGGEFELPKISNTSLESAQTNITTYIIGAFVFATALSTSSFIISLTLLNFFRPKKVDKTQP
jgi:glycosyltransferase involved in cell wall biosynthesis